MRRLRSRSISVRPAESSDADLVASVYVPSWRAAYRDLLPPEALSWIDEATWAARFRGQPEPVRSTLLALKRRCAIGMVSFGPDRDDAAFGEIYAVYVLPASQRLGVGRRLLDGALARMHWREVRLWCAVANTGTRQFYEACGFVVDGAVGTYDVPGATVPTVRYTVFR
jgi:ribosomal protein S18 acetylase RimI-like enzyme